MPTSNLKDTGNGGLWVFLLLIVFVCGSGLFWRTSSDPRTLQVQQQREREAFQQKNAERVFEEMQKRERDPERLKFLEDVLEKNQPVPWSPRQGAKAPDAIDP